MEIKQIKNELVLTSTLNETTALAELVTSFESAAKEGPAVVLNFEGLKRANSCGIATLIRAIEKAHTPVHFTRCPVWLVEQLNQIDEFFSLHVKILSVFAPYIEEKTKNYILKLIDIDPDFLNHETIQSLDQCTDEQGNKLIADFDPADFFGFLSRDS